MRWRKANNLLREKPYLLDVYRVRNAAAAQRLARSAGIATASDIMSMAQNRSGTVSYTHLLHTIWPMCLRHIRHLM